MSRTMPHKSAKSVGKAVLIGSGFGLAAVAMWAAYLSFARAGVNTGLTPEDFVFLRYGTAGVIMLPWLFKTGPLTLGGVGWTKGAALAVMAGPLFIAAGVGGYVFAPLAHGAVIQPATITLASMAIAALFLKEVLSRNQVVGAAVIIAGITLIAAGQSGAPAPSAWIGDLLFVLAGLFWTGFTVLIRKWGIGGIPATGAVSVLSAAVVVPAVLLFGTLERITALPTMILVTQVIVQGVLSGVLAVVAYGKAVEHLGAARASLFPALVPAATLFVGMPVTGEFPSVTEWAGAILASLGLVIAMGVLSAGKLQAPADKARKRAHLSPSTTKRAK